MSDRQFYDRVLEQTSTAGTGAYALDGPAANYRAFGGQLDDGQRAIFHCRNLSGDTWETFEGVYSEGPYQVTRETLLESSTGAWIDWPAVGISDQPRVIYLAPTGSAMQSFAGWPTMAAFRAGGPHPSSLVQRVWNYYAGDGVSGDFAADLSDTTTADNGGTVIVIDGVRWKRLGDLSSIHAAAFGVRGDGADYTTQLLAAGAVADEVILPAGDVGFSATLDIAKLVGQGVDTTRLVAAAPGTYETAAIRAIGATPTLLGSLATAVSQGVNEFTFAPGVDLSAVGPGSLLQVIDKTREIATHGAVGTFGVGNTISADLYGGTAEVVDWNAATNRLRVTNITGSFQPNGSGLAPTPLWYSGVAYSPATFNSVGDTTYEKTSASEDDGFLIRSGTGVGAARDIRVYIFSLAPWVGEIRLQRATTQVYPMDWTDVPGEAYTSDQDFLYNDGLTTSVYYRLIAHAWTSGTAFSFGDPVIHDGKHWRAITSHTSAGSFDATKFEDVTGTRAASGDTIEDQTSGATALVRYYGGSYSLARPEIQDGEYYTVASVDGQTVRIFGYVRMIGIPTWAEISLCDPVSAHYEGFTLVAPGAADPAYSGFAGILVRHGRGVTLRNLNLSGSGQANARLESVCDFTVSAIISVLDVNDEDATTQYGLNLSNCQDGEVHGCNLASIRHPLSVGGQPDAVVNRGLWIHHNSFKTYGDATSADFHENVEFCTYESNTMQGGVYCGGRENTIRSNDISWFASPELPSAILLIDLIGGNYNIIDNDIRLLDMGVLAGGSPATARNFVDLVSDAWNFRTKLGGTMHISRNRFRHEFTTANAGSGVSLRMGDIEPGLEINVHGRGNSMLTQGSQTIGYCMSIQSLAAYYEPFAEVHLSDNTARNGGIARVDYARRIIVQGGASEGTLLYGLYLLGADNAYVSVNGIDVLSPGRTPVRVAGQSGKNIERLIVKGCSLINGFASATQTGIFENGALGIANIDRADIIGNVLSGTDADHLYTIGMSGVTLSYLSGNIEDGGTRLLTGTTVYGSERIQATATWDPGSLADGAGETSAAITVTGAVFGDFVDVAAPYDLQGITCNAYVSAADAVKIRLQNETGGIVDLASGTWKVRVRKGGS